QLGQSGRSSLAPRIKAEGFHLVARLVRNHGDTAQVILVQVAGFDRTGTACSAVGVGDDAVAAHAVALFHRAAGQGDLLVQAAHMDGAGALPAVGVAAGEQLPVGAVGHGRAVAALGDLGGFVKGAPGDAAAIAAGHIAVGVVGVAGVFGADTAAADLADGVQPVARAALATVAISTLLGPIDGIKWNNYLFDFSFFKHLKNLPG